MSVALESVLIHGLGVEGRAAAAYFASTGVEVLGFDEVGTAVPGVRMLDSDAARGRLSSALLYLRSPGVPPNDPLYEAAVASGATVTTPTGWWLATLAPSETICITGTKGKSTTTALVAASLRAGGVTSRAYGNIGTPPLAPALPSETVPVVELSSYMCADLIAPAGGRRWRHAVTNLYKEHTTWHGSESAYRTAKLSPFRWTPPCAGIAPASVIAAESLPDAVEALEERTALEGTRLRIDDETIVLDELSDAFRSPGLRLAARAAAAVLLPVLGERLTSSLSKAGREWIGLPSRQASVRSRDGRLWIDDALATVPEAVMQALDRFEDRPVRLILGGKDRGQDLTALLARAQSSPDVRVFGFGEVASQVEAAEAPIFATMEAAVWAARDDCPPGGVVLFSPAAPSGAPHRDYRERSEIFAVLATQAEPR